MVVNAKGVKAMRATAGTEAVLLRSLSKSWRGPAGPIHAVRGIDVSIAQGETVALLGPNGAGKSTTIDMVLGLVRPDDGALRCSADTRARRCSEG